MKTWMLAAAVAMGLAACSSTSNVRNDAYRQIAVKQEEVVAYFNLDGRVANQKVANGYYRKLLGTTSDNGFIVQDFYSRNDQKQSDPLKITHKEALQVFDNQHTDSEVTLYYANGARLESSVYDKGKLVGSSTAYYPNGTVFHVNQFDQGMLHGRSQYFYADGKLAANLEYVSNRLVNAEGWNKAQKPVVVAEMPKFLQELQTIDQQNQLEIRRLAQ